MKAVQIHSYGNPDVLVYEEALQPEAGPGEVLIRVHAAGVNPVDWKTRRGPSGRSYTFPLILGWDVSGVVEALGPGVTEFQIGEAVYGLIRFPQAGGAYAEYTSAPVTHVAPKPTTIDYIHAAAVPLVALTAWQALFDQANLSAGQTVLIHGAAGGVGHFAVQLAKAKGADVIGTASSHNADFLRELGVDQFIDYTTTPFETVVHNVDVVFDTVGGETQQRSFDVLKPGGALVSIVRPAPSAERAAAAGVSAYGILVQPNAAQLVEIGQLIDQGQVRVIVETVLPLAEAHKAHELSEGRHVRGKIVLRVD